MSAPQAPYLCEHGEPIAEYCVRCDAPPAPTSGDKFEQTAAEIAALRGSSALYQTAMERNLARAEKAEAALAAKDAEIAVLKGMIAYALEAPDAEATKTILTDALDGVTGADNVSDVRGERERLRAEVERLRGALERIAHQDIDCGLGKGICDTCNGPTIAREALERK